MQRLIRLAASAFFFIACALAPLHAQSAAPDLLHQVIATLSRHSAVRAGFTQQRLNPALAQPQVSSGELLFVTSHGMLWNVQQPYRETLVLDGSHATRIDANGHAQTVRDQRGMSQISQMLQAMLAGQFEPVLRQFDVHADGTPAKWSVQFTPRQSRVAQVLRDITLSGDDYLQGIHIDMKDGTQTDIRLHDTRDAGPLSSAEKQALALP